MQNATSNQIVPLVHLLNHSLHMAGVVVVAAAAVSTLRLAADRYRFCSFLLCSYFYSCYTFSTRVAISRVCAAFMQTLLVFCYLPWSRTAFRTLLLFRLMAILNFQNILSNSHKYIHDNRQLCQIFTCLTELRMPLVNAKLKLTELNGLHDHFP